MPHCTVTSFYSIACGRGLFQSREVCEKECARMLLLWYDISSQEGMEMHEDVEFTNMCMVCSGDQVLVIDRKKQDWPGVAFPGGHVELGESFTDAVIREVWEEKMVQDTLFCYIRRRSFEERCNHRKRERSGGRIWIRSLN